MYHSGIIDDEPVAGMLERPARMVSPHWGFYVTDDDVDEVAARVAPVGGEVIVEPDVDYQRTVEGRFTLHGGPSWFELRVPDANAVAAFYARVIGWTIESTARAGGRGRFATVADPQGATIALK